MDAVNKDYVRQHRTPKIIGRGKLPTFSRITSEYGDESLERILNTIILGYDSKKRDTGHVGLKHALESPYEIDLWIPGHHSTDVIDILTLTHDFPENDGEGIAGALYLCRTIGNDIFPEFEHALRSLTDFNTQTLKEIRENGANVSGRDRIFKKDIVADYEAFKEKLQYNTYVNSENQKSTRIKMVNQTVQVDNRLARIEYPSEDKDRFEAQCRKIRSIFHDERYLNPNELQQAFDDIFDRLDSVLKNSFRENGDSFMDSGNSPFYHAILTAGYRSYVTGLIEYDQKHPNSPIKSIDLLTAKIKDMTHNLKNPQGLHDYKTQRVYLKAEIVLDVAEDFLSTYSPDDKRAQILRKNLDFMNKVIVYRILADNYEILGRADAGFDHLEEWLPKKFDQIYDRLERTNPGFMKWYRDTMVSNPTALGLQPRNNVLQGTFDNLIGQ